MCSQLVGALSPVNHIGLYQGYAPTKGRSKLIMVVKQQKTCFHIQSLYLQPPTSKPLHPFPFLTNTHKHTQPSNSLRYGPGQAKAIVGGCPSAQLINDDQRVFGGRLKPRTVATLLQGCKQTHSIYIVLLT